MRPAYAVGMYCFNAWIKSDASKTCKKIPLFDVSLASAAPVILPPGGPWGSVHKAREMWPRIVWWSFQRVGECSCSSVCLGMVTTAAPGVPLDILATMASCIQLEQCMPSYHCTGWLIFSLVVNLFQLRDQCLLPSLVYYQHLRVPVYRIQVVQLTCLVHCSDKRERKMCHCGFIPTS